MPKLRPIEREVWSADAAAASLFAFNQAAKLSLGAQQYRQRFSSASAGVQVAGRGLGGGVFDPGQAPRATTRGTT